MSDLGHLTVTLRPGEWVNVGEAKVRVASIEPGRVRLMVIAPREIPVLRSAAKKVPS